MQYMGIISVGIMCILILFMFVIEHIGKKQKQCFFIFKSPLYYYDIKGKSNVSNVLMACGGIHVFLFLLFLVIDANIVQYCEIILKNINSIESIIIAFFTVVISVIIFSVTLGPKEYYLSRTRDEVNRQFGIHIIFQILSVYATTSVIAMFFLQEGVSNISELLWFITYEICCVIIVFGGLYGLIMIGMLTLGSSRMELYSLNKLYMKFWNNSVLKLVNETEDVIYANLGYLLKRHMNLKYIKNKQLEKVKEIEFIREIGDDLKWSEFAVKRLILFLSVPVVTSGITLLITHNYELLLLTIVLFVVCIVFLRGKKVKKITNKYVTAILMDWNGFIIRSEESEKKDKYIGTVSLIHNLAGQKYIRSVCNMMALYCIICTCWKGDCEIIVDSIDDMIEYIGRNDESKGGYDKALRYLPVMVCGYYFFVRFGKEKFPRAIIELYDSFKLTKKEKGQYYVTVNSFIASASQYRPSLMDRENAKKGYWSMNYYERYIEKNGYSQLFKDLRRV